MTLALSNSFERSSNLMKVMRNEMEKMMARNGAEKMKSERI
jgi:hypothetical protein